MTRGSGSDTAQAAPAQGAGRVLKTAEDEWNALIPFVRENVGGGRLGDWVELRDLMLDAFEARGDPDLAVKRINAYYGAFVVGRLKPGGAGMRVHKDMKDRMDAAQALLTRVGAADRLDRVKGIGGFNIRRNTNNKAKLSNHSFGLAIDLDPALNPNLPLSSPVGERARWGGLVEFLTGTHPYGPESVRLQTARAYVKCLPDVVTLCQASAEFVAACAAPPQFAAAVQAGLRRKFGLTVPLDDCGALAALAARHDHAAVQAKLGQLQVPAAKGAEMADLLVYGQSVATASQAKGLKPDTSGTAATTARFGFVNLPAEVIAGLAAGDGGGLRWLGSATGIKDYMHFDFRDSELPPLVLPEA